MTSVPIIPKFLSPDLSAELHICIFILNYRRITEEIKEEIFKMPIDKWKWKITIQNLLDVAKATVRGKFIAIQSYLRIQEKSQVNHLTKHKAEKEETKSKVSRRKEIIKIRAE